MSRTAPHGYVVLLVLAGCFTQIEGENTGDRFGWALAAVGDVDADD